MVFFVLAVGVQFFPLSQIRIFNNPDRSDGKSKLPDLNRTYKNDKIFLFSLGKKSNWQGFGSLVVNTMLLGFYFEQVQNRSLVVQEAGLKNYRWNHTHGLFQGFYESNFVDTLQNDSTYQVSSSPSFCKAWQPSCDVVQLSTLSKEHFQLRDEIKKYYHLSNNEEDDNMKYNRRSDFYHQFSNYACRKLPRLREQVQGEINHKLTTRLSSLYSSPPSFDDPILSVAFHIRRTDKFTELPVLLDFNKINKTIEQTFAASNYVQTYVRSLQLQLRHHGEDNVVTTNISKGFQQPEHCFIATDDYRAVSELQTALQEYNLTCRLWTLTEPNYKSSRNRSDFVQLLAEVQVLVQAQHFVGSFTSSIGTFVAMMRHCHWSSKKANEKKKHSHGNTQYVMPHYAHSYGVDLENWNIM